MKKSIIAVTIVTALVVVGTTTMSFARGGMGHGYGAGYGNGMGRGPGQVQDWLQNLTEQQQEEVRTLIGQHHKARYADQIKLRAKRAEIAAEMTADTPNERRIKALVVEANTINNRMYADQVEFQIKMVKEYNAPVMIGSMGPGFGPGMMGRGGCGGMGKGMGMGQGKGMGQGPCGAPCPRFQQPPAEQPEPGV